VRNSVCECVTAQDKLGLYAVPLQSHNSDNGFLQQFTVNEGKDLKFIKHITHLRINMVIVITLYVKFYTILFIVMHCFAKLSRKTDKADFTKQYLHSKKMLESPKNYFGIIRLSVKSYTRRICTDVNQNDRNTEQVKQYLEFYLITASKCR